MKEKESTGEELAEVNIQQIKQEAAHKKNNKKGTIARDDVTFL